MKSRTHKRHTRRNITRKKVHHAYGKKKGPAVPLGGKKGGLNNRHLQPYFESKSLQTPVSSAVYLNVADATATVPAQTTIIVPPAWANGLARGLADNQLIGRQVYDRYLTMKLELSFKDLVTHALGSSLAPISNLTVIQGWCMRKALPIESTGVALAPSLFGAIVGRAMIEDEFGSKFLSFSNKWRNIKVIKRFNVRPKNRQKMFNPIPSATDDQPVQALPVNLKFDWTIKRKQFLTQGESTAFLRGDSWIPFVAFYSSSLAGYEDDQVPQYKELSKIWYTDA